ncbi:MAG: UvrD-helicase domain-containing protein [Candidatus Stygibacter australis]|nr:UvrD-helicase domain-containing protein [Candidatus Stygibacter australis]MDP8321592.1 UvrD-helicase domain-containing protein [Candidatus Stygibacter australis]
MIQNILTPNIIRASAGTGKTYRLSLEYIALLLKLKEEIKFQEILVITFTKKATAEIRQRIIEFLHELITDGNSAADLKASLLKNYEDLDFSPENIKYLSSVYQDIITNKSLLNISTLDSFINTIFKSLIAPYHNISGYAIDPLINDDILPEIYDSILSDKYFPLLENIFQNKLSRNISAYDKFIKAILDNRWLFEFYYNSQIPDLDHITLAETAYDQFTHMAQDFCQRFSLIINSHYQDKTWKKVFAINWYNALNEDDKLQTLSHADIGEHILSFLMNMDFLLHQYPLLGKTKNIWHGGSIFNKKTEVDLKNEMLELQENLLSAWRNLLFYQLVIPEHKEILELSNVIFQKYDQIKFRDKILTYNDLAAYTWKYLYDPEISIIDQNEVLNLFYEQLSYRIKFILIDEFQDTSILQWNIFAPLIKEITSGNSSSELGSFAVVGDEKQAIYSWRSGERELLLNMESLIKVKFRKNELKTSYRSSKAVIAFVNLLFTDDYFITKLKESNLKWDYTEVNIIKEEPGYTHLQIENLSSEPDDFEFRDKVKEFIQNIYLPAIENKTLSPADTAILTRTHKEMNTIAEVLRELKIDYIDESSLTIIAHRAVKPVMALLNWFNNLDFYSLIIFLRSDAILLDSELLKDILVLWQDCKTDNNAFCQNLYEKFSQLYPIKIISRLHDQITEPLKLIKNIYQEFNLTNIFDQETDYANITKFLDLIADFLATNLNYTHDLGGLLRYLNDSKDSETFIQAGIQKQDVLKIITIHKSKGLEFDTVILIHNCPKNRSHLSELSIYPKYNKDFSALDGCLFTYNYQSLIKKSPANALLQMQESRQNVEDINVWYVALTRAKRNLYALFTYNIKKGLEKYIDGFQPDNPDINKLMIGSIVNAFADESSSEQNSLIIKTGTPEKYDTSKEDTSEIFSASQDISKWFSPPPEDYFQLKENWQDKISPHDLKKLAHAKVLGNIAHYYLEQITFDSPAARQKALTLTLAFYGSLVTSQQINAVVEKTKAVMQKYSHLFDPSQWDQAYCEWTVFDKFHNEYRIDRLLVSHQRKEIQVVDYKTGEITDKDQISKYNKLISEIPFVKNQGYTLLDGIFLKIEL